MPARTIRQMEKNGRWRAGYVGSDRRWHYKTWDTKADAQTWLDLETASIAVGDWIPPAARKTTVDVLAGRWFDTTVNLKAKTLEGYASLLRNQVLPKFGSYLVGDVSRAEVRSWLARLQADGLSPSRTRQARSVLSQVMEFAIESGVVRSNPARGVKVIGSSDREMLALTADQVDRLADNAEAIRAGSAALIYLLAYGGLRWGEAAALRVGRCDLRRSRVMVRESVSETGGKVFFGPTKTHQARTVVLPRSVADRIAAHLSDREANDPEALVFADKAGGALRNSNWRVRVWKPACAASGMPEGLRIHDLRHTAASLAVSAGGNVKAVQRMLGHSTATQTMDRYAHLFTDDLEALADRLETVFLQANAYSARTQTDEDALELAS